jgi:hypothetical protein
MSHFEFLEGAATFTVVSTVAEAADGCGRGWYYNGRRCVPMDEPGYGYRLWNDSCRGLSSCGG